MKPVFKICPSDVWEDFRRTGNLMPSLPDQTDGYVHLSTASQLRATARRHFGGREGLVLIAFDPERLGEGLKWEPSRNGELFPHFYGDPPLAAAIWARPLSSDGATHRFPPEAFE
jgi:uncharacterized protein (DUF952 family)